MRCVLRVVERLGRGEKGKSTGPFGCARFVAEGRRECKKKGKKAGP